MPQSNLRDPAFRAQALEHEKEVERIKREARRAVDAEEQPPRQSLHLYTVTDLLARPRPSYLVDQWIPTGALGQLVGESESLKSFFMTHVGLCVATGQDTCFGYQVRQGPVVYIAAEGGGAFQYRILGWCREHGVDPETVPFRVIPMPVNFRDPGFQQELVRLVQAFNPVLIVVDTLSRCMPGADENSARDTGEVVTFCTDLITRTEAAVIFVHHPTKSDPRGGGRGSGAIFAAVDTELRSATTSEREANGSQAIQITCAKQKDDLKPDPLDLVGHVVSVCDPAGNALAHDSGRPITTLVLRMATDGDRVAVTSNLSKDIVQFLKTKPKKSTAEVATSLKRNKADVVTAIGELVEAGTLHRIDVKGRGGIKQVYAVAATLLDAGPEL